MGERKVLIHYISPDFDPSLIPKFKKEKHRLEEVRNMLPFSMRCNSCGEYMYLGKKFNMKRERLDENYLGKHKQRFYMKCCVCSNEITFKTDPKNSGYELETGATRNYELWKDTDAAIEQEEQERKEEDDNDAMKALENRTLDSKLEMDVLDALDEIKSINQRHERVDTDLLLDRLAGKRPLLVNGITEDDETLVKSIQFHKKGSTSTISNNNDDDNDDEPIKESTPNINSLITNQLQKSKKESNGLGISVVARKRIKVESNGSTTTSTTTTTTNNTKNDNKSSDQDKGTVVTSTGGGLGSLIGNYGSDSD